MATTLSVKQLGQRFRDRSLSPETLARACLTAIEEQNESMGCFVHVAGGMALAEAAQATADFAAGIDRGPLQGVPYAVADVIDVASLPTTCGSRLMEHHVPDTTAHIVECLRQAGAVFLGKTSIFEFAVGGPGTDSLFPPARNPYDRQRTAGATGAGAAVAAGLVSFAIVPDTGGAARGSAALCGVAGLKPSYGLLSCRGIFSVASSLDHCGIIATSADDIELVLRAVVPPDIMQQASRASNGADLVGALTIGITTGHAEAHPSIKRALQETATKCQARGAQIKPVAIDYLDQLLAAGQVIYAVECLAIHREALRDHPDQFGQNTRHRMIVGTFLDDRDYATAKQVADTLAQRFNDEVMSRCDVLLCPATGGPAPLIEETPYGIAGRSGAQTLPFNVTGHPAITIPCGTAETLPLGLQIVGQKTGDFDLLAAAHAIATLDTLAQQARS